MTNHLPSKALAIIAALAAAVLVFNLGSCGRSFAPEHWAAPEATRAAIDPALEATRAYNTQVIPTIQAVEAAEAEATIRTRERLKRARWTGATWLALVVGGAFALAFVTWLGAWAWMGVQRARFTPTPRRQFAHAGHLHDGQTGWIVPLGEPNAANQEHAQLLTAGKVAQIEAFTSVLGKQTIAERRVMAYLEEGN